MTNENSEGIELILSLHKELKRKNSNHPFLDLIEVNEEKDNFRRGVDFDKRYCRDSDDNVLQSYVRYSLDLLKADFKKNPNEVPMENTETIIEYRKPREIYLPSMDIKYDGWDEWD